MGFHRYAKGLLECATGGRLTRCCSQAPARQQPTYVNDLVVSLTSFPPRIGKARLVIQSLLNQSVQPRQIVLYLSLQEFPDRSVPRPLAALTGRRFEIRYVQENSRSYKKLLPALVDFPQATIVTFDDDRIYANDCLARLWAASRATPNTIIYTLGELRFRRLVRALQRMAARQIAGAQHVRIATGKLWRALSTWVLEPLG